MKKIKDNQTLNLLENEENSLEADTLEESALQALAVIRTETALSRFPIHRLSKGREVQIELKNQGGAVYWQVSHNSNLRATGPIGLQN